jgi:NTE family protein
VIIVVNAETDPDPAIDLANHAPSLAALMNAVSGAQIRHNNFETLMLVNDLLRQWGKDLSSEDHQVQTHFINVSFDDFKDEKERRYFKRLPTSFVLTDNQVERLIEAGKSLLLESPDFQQLVESLN